MQFLNNENDDPERLFNISRYIKGFMYMLIDTHCHINLMVKKEFDQPLTPQEIECAEAIIKECTHAGVTTIINVGTSVIESKNCIALRTTI